MNSVQYRARFEMYCKKCKYVELFHDGRSGKCMNNILHSCLVHNNTNKKLQDFCVEKQCFEEESIKK